MREKYIFILFFFGDKILKNSDLQIIKINI